MAYGNNVLEYNSSKWSVTNGVYTNNTLVLMSGGKAEYTINNAIWSTIPTTLYFAVVATAFADNYAPAIYAELNAIDSDGKKHVYRLPIVNNRNGIFVVEFTTSIGDYDSCSFTLYTNTSVTFSSWILATDSEEIDLSSIEDELPRILATYNTGIITVAQKETTVAIIGSVLLADRDVGGKLQITVISSEACEVTVRIKDNSNSELFAPVYFDVPAGRSNISIPHAYMSRLSGAHTFSATMQCSTGKLTINTRSILFVIDSGGIAERVTAIPLTVMDLAIEQPEGATSPTTIYAIGENTDGIMLVYSRGYTETAESSWEPVYTVPSGIAAAIEYDAIWYLPTGADYYTLYTDDTPWVFVVKTNGTLVGQLGADDTTQVELSTGVSSVAAVRGYKSELFWEQDQGLIVAYIKDGQAYYRNYTQEAEETSDKVWEIERQIEELGDDIVDLRVHRLNDYRVGFVATKSDGSNVWCLTERTYVASSMPRETVSFNIVNELISFVCPPDLFRTLEITATLSEDAHTIYIESNLDVYLDDDILNCLTFSTSLDIDKIEFVDNVITIHMLDTLATTVNIATVRTKFCTIFDNWGVDRFAYAEATVSPDIGPPDEIIQFDIDLDVAVTTIGISNIYANDEEQVNFNVSLITSLNTYNVSTLYQESPREVISFNVSCVTTVTCVFAGTLPA
ncbi:MAG: hypothetical protein R3Y58_01880 [Eubacteriales bacterium]